MGLTKNADLRAGFIRHCVPILLRSGAALKISNTASAILTIDLSAIAANYKTLADLSLPAETAAVVKADAYGLGIEPVAKTLEAAGAKTFFVATLDEAIELRRHTKAAIFTLNGFFQGAESEYQENGIAPVLNSINEISRYQYHLPPIWHIDTGMNRLGLNSEEIVQAFTAAHVRPAFIMSHLVSSEDANSPLNQQQLKKFRAIARHCWEKDKDLKFSLANSSGIFQGNDFHFDLVRPGAALYSVNPTPDAANPMRPVVELKTRILQIHNVSKGESAGYGATYQFERDTKVAVISFGYADGFLRASGHSTELYWADHTCPIRGRISMDLIIVDIGDLPPSVQPPQTGDWMEIIGRNQSVDKLAQDRGTIPYEILTSLSRRVLRIYKS